MAAQTVYAIHDALVLFRDVCSFIHAKERFLPDDEYLRTEKRFGELGRVILVEQGVEDPSKLDMRKKLGPDSLRLFLELRAKFIDLRVKFG